MSAGLFVGVMDPGTLVYIGVPDRAAFDRIARPCRDHAPEKQLLTKSVEADGVYVVFQHWLERSAPQESNRAVARVESEKQEIVSPMKTFIKLAGATGLEPATSSVTGQRSTSGFKYRFDSGPGNSGRKVNVSTLAPPGVETVCGCRIVGFCCKCGRWFP